MHNDALRREIEGNFRASDRASICLDEYAPPVKSSIPFPTRLSLGLLVAVAAACGSAPESVPIPPLPQASLPKGEICEANNSAKLELKFDPPTLVLAPATSRLVRLTVDPDLCSAHKVTFAAESAGVRSITEGTVNLRSPAIDFEVEGTTVGRTSITAKLERPDPNDATKNEVVELKLPIDVREAVAPSCNAGEGRGQASLGPGVVKVNGQGPLAHASVGTSAAAFARTDEFALPPFGASVSCARTGDFTSGTPYIALGPAVAFEGSAPITSSDVLRREIDFSIPVNPALFPSRARMRHLEVLYSGPRTKGPRVIPIASPRIEDDGNGGYVLKFSSPWLGSYQAVVRRGAGEATRSRRLTHRAVLGFSMGGGGAASFGLRHHDKFDAVAPLGGLADYTWLSWFVETYVSGGFCPASNPNCQKYEPNRYPISEPLAHTMDFNHFWYEEGNGNGGTFARESYVQIFGDLSLAFGNLASQNKDPALLHMVAGPTKDDPWIKGDLSAIPGVGAGVDCSIAVSPVSDAKDAARQRQIEQACAKFRCDPKNQWTAKTGYFDDEYNPDGSKPVITFCDGGQKGKSPYKNTFTPLPEDRKEPVNFTVAVDLNDNGIRDENEPIIRSGHEPWDDCGLDGLCDKDEPGYDAGTNPDPNQDDYDYTLSPGGTEGNHHYEKGEKFRDDGLDGVPNTKDRHVAGDPGEGDGVFSETAGLTNMRKFDAHSIVSGWTTGTPGGPLTDEALARLDIVTDGGVRDLFNFASVANHLAGSVSARKDASGKGIKSLAFYNGYEQLPGQNPAKPNELSPSNLLWKDIVDMPNMRYGAVDASPFEIREGDGMHVGTVPQLLNRLLFGFYYVGQRWPDADRTRAQVALDNPLTQAEGPDFPLECVVKERCEKFFTGPKTKRTGPISITLPPGYANADNRARNVRYPVVYVLHGYGQDPRDLEALAIITNNFMNDGNRSSVNRLPKFIVVYVDGRCRSDEATGKPECIQGSFYVDSARPGGPQFDQWFDEVIDLVDQNFRTMKPSEVEVSD